MKPCKSLPSPCNSLTNPCKSFSKRLNCLAKPNSSLPKPCKFPKKDTKLRTSRRLQLTPMKQSINQKSASLAIIALLGISVFRAHSQQPGVSQAGIWQPPAGFKQVPIWPNGAPNMGRVARPPESVEITKAPDLVGGRPWTAVHDVTVPTMTIFAPEGTNTHAAVVVFPGGGFHILAMDLEGTEVCDWLTSKRDHMRPTQVSRSKKQPLLGQRPTHPRHA